MKTIEVIYPEFQNIYADLYQIEFMKKCDSSLKIVYTHYNDEPYFVKHKVDVIYIGSMPDSKILKTIEKLNPYKDKIKQMIENNIFFLIFGNALEIFSKYIIENSKKYKGLNIFDYYIEKDMNNKYVSWYIGNYNNINIIGHKSQFSLCKNIKNNFIETINGYSSDIENKNEGIHYKNFYATYLLGPFLIMNPYFTKYIFKEIGINYDLVFESDLIRAYEKRLEHFTKPNVRFIMTDHG